MGFLDFFRNDFSEILGIYFDGDKIFFARLTNTIEFDEINFELDADDTATATEQLAARIAAHAAKNAWKTNHTALALRDGTATTFRTEFKNVPANEIDSAVKIWATAHVGKDARYSSIKIADEIWMEALPADTVDEFAAAWLKNAMTLDALTETPTTARALTPYNRATFAAEIALNRADPNILANKSSAWNLQKIALTAAAVFLIALAAISARLGHEYAAASNALDAARNRLAAQSDTADLKNILDTNAAESNGLAALAAEQNPIAKNFAALLALGRNATSKILLDKITASDETLELAGAADSPDAVKSYLSRLKTAGAADARLENSALGDGLFDFSARVSF